MIFTAKIIFIPYSSNHFGKILLRLEKRIDMTALEVLALIAGIVGIIGSIVPGLPGPPISWIGILMAYVGENDGSHPVTTTALFVWMAVMVIVTVLDYTIPASFTRMTGGTKHASRGAIIGLFAGMLIPPVGMILGSLLGAFLAEIIFAKKRFWDSVKAALGAFLGFLVGTGMKLITSGLMLYYIVVSIW